MGKVWAFDSEMLGFKCHPQCRCLAPSYKPFERPLLLMGRECLPCGVGFSKGCAVYAPPNNCCCLSLPPPSPQRSSPSVASPLANPCPAHGQASGSCSLVAYPRWAAVRREREGNRLCICNHVLMLLPSSTLIPAQPKSLPLSHSLGLSYLWGCRGARWAYSFSFFGCQPLWTRGHADRKTDSRPHGPGRRWLGSAGGLG